MFKIELELTDNEVYELKQALAYNNGSSNVAYICEVAEEMEEFFKSLLTLEGNNEDM